ncbi:MAG TPA: hypothetical protein VF344_09300 [Candidatus Limnocylindrales bacterium]
MRSTKLTVAIAGAVISGGAAVVLLFGAASAFAASPTPSTQPAASAATQVAPGVPFGRAETVSDASVVAAAIGISEADLNTALSGGQTIAAVAKAHNVDPQKVIDALTTDGLNELAAQVTAGTLTQAQADAQKAAVTQRATDQVNGTFRGGAGGPHGAGGAACPAAPAASVAPAASAATN